MRHLWTTALLAALLCSCPLFAHSATAAFGNCRDYRYIAQFDPRLGEAWRSPHSTAEHDCLIRVVVPVTTASGVRHIRIISHFDAGWAASERTMRMFEQGVHQTAAALASLGSFEMNDVTVLLSDNFPPPGEGEQEFSNIQGWANPPSDDECHVILFLLHPGLTGTEAAGTTAHELFHCVQYASAGRARVDTNTRGSGQGGDWWIEGSAEWFMALAVPEADLRGRVADFDRVSVTDPLTRLAYSAYVFFSWLGQQSGPAGIVPFLRQMAESRDESAQRTAMAAALPPDKWLRFAQDYLDMRIRNPHGTPIGSVPQDGDNWEWEHTRTTNIALEPFLLKRGYMTFHCGVWRINARPLRSHAAKPQSGAAAAWGPIPTELDTMSGGGGIFRFAGMNAQETAMTLQVSATQASSCEECAGTREVDVCLVGTWDQDPSGMLNWINRNIHKATVTGQSQSGNTVTLNRDGTFVTGDSSVDVSLEGSGGSSGRGNLASQGSGRWSAAGGQFNLCPDSVSSRGTITVISHGHPITIPYPHLAAQTSSRAYSCNTSSFTVTTPMPRATPVVTTYNKVH